MAQCISKLNQFENEKYVHVRGFLFNNYIFQMCYVPYILTIDKTQSKARQDGAVSFLFNDDTGSLPSRQDVLEIGLNDKMIVSALLHFVSS